MFQLDKEYELINIMTNVSKNTIGIITNCMTTTFRNQGTTTVHVYPETSGGSYIILKPGQERTYGSIFPNVKYTAKWNCEFQGSGTNNLLIEQEIVQPVKC
ncbi:MAG: hypothetical protein WC967_14675 [Balneolaceae bacterium]